MVGQFDAAGRLPNLPWVNVWRRVCCMCCTLACWRSLRGGGDTAVTKKSDAGKSTHRNNLNWTFHIIISSSCSNCAQHLMDLCLPLWVVVCLITPACAHQPHYTLTHSYIYLLTYALNVLLTYCMQTLHIYLYARTYLTIYSTVGVKQVLFGIRSCRVRHILFLKEFVTDVYMWHCLFMISVIYPLTNFPDWQRLRETYTFCLGPVIWTRLLHQDKTECIVTFWDIQRNLMTSFPLICDTDSRGPDVWFFCKKCPDEEPGSKFLTARDANMARFICGLICSCQFASFQGPTASVYGDVSYFEPSKMYCFSSYQLYHFNVPNPWYTCSISWQPPMVIIITDGNKKGT